MAALRRSTPRGENASQADGVRRLGGEDDQLVPAGSGDGPVDAPACARRVRAQSKRGISAPRVERRRTGLDRRGRGGRRRRPTPPCASKIAGTLVALLVAVLDDHTTRRDAAADAAVRSTRRDVRRGRPAPSKGPAAGRNAPPRGRAAPIRRGCRAGSPRRGQPFPSSSDRHAVDVIEVRGETMCIARCAVARARRRGRVRRRAPARPGPPTETAAAIAPDPEQRSTTGADRTPDVGQRPQAMRPPPARSRASGQNTPGPTARVTVRKCAQPVRCCSGTPLARPATRSSKPVGHRAGRAGATDRPRRHAEQVSGEQLGVDAWRGHPGTPRDGARPSAERRAARVRWPGLLVTAVARRSRAASGQLGLAVGALARVDHRRQVAVENLIEVVGLEADPVIGDAVLGEVVRADAL